MTDKREIVSKLLDAQHQASVVNEMLHAARNHIHAATTMAESISRQLGDLSRALHQLDLEQK